MELTMTFTEKEAGILAAALATFITQMDTLSESGVTPATAKALRENARNGRDLAIRLSNTRIYQANKEE